MTAPSIITHETAPNKLGTKRPNLVTERDNQWEKVQFRVQCEVWLEPDVAAEVDEKIMQGPKRSRKTIREAKSIVLDKVDPGANAVFIDIVTAGFDELIRAETTEG